MIKEGGYLNTELHFGNIYCTRDMEEVSTVEMQIEERARKNPEAPLTNLHSFINCEMLNESLGMLNPKSAPGVDWQTWRQYCENCIESKPDLSISRRIKREVTLNHLNHLNFSLTLSTHPQLYSASRR